MSIDGGPAFGGRKTLFVCNPGQRPPRIDEADEITGDLMTVKGEMNDIRTIEVYRPGATMRQYYKAAALTGLVSPGDDYDDQDYCNSEFARAVANLADAMLAEDAEHEKGAK